MTDTYGVSQRDCDFSDCCDAPCYTKSMYGGTGEGLRTSIRGRTTYDSSKKGTVHFCSKCKRRCTYTSKPTPVIEQVVTKDDRTAAMFSGEFAPPSKGRAINKSQHD